MPFIPCLQPYILFLDKEELLYSLFACIFVRYDYS
uniref:Uncharacterized protein n=1 Tax=Siphoviridae sp. ctEgn5 TaxID=2825398 RepID=A0A8S5PI17_9CAUD|nr:MAG TPA: hypothetical protein [Siphoviridae sp. ctEgn5]